MGTELKRALEPEVRERPLPLVLEIIPGQAAEGLIDIYEPGSFEDLPLRELCTRTLNRTDWSIEERQILEDIRRQLDGGRLLCRGHAIEGTALDFAEVQETEAGEQYLYVAVRVVKPQEGGTETTGEAPRRNPVRRRADCPKCRAELERQAALAEALFDELDHGAGIYRGLWEEYPCPHQGEDEEIAHG